METLKHRACTVSWVARLGRSWLSPGKATRFSHWDSTVDKKKLINVIMFHPSAEPFTGCPTKHIVNTHCHSFFSDTAPVYLSDLLHVYSPSRRLRSSSDSRTLRISHVKTKTFGHRSFSYAALSVWNSLPREIRHIQSTTAFKTALTTHLFKFYHCWLNLYSPPFSVNYFS